MKLLASLRAVPCYLFATRDLDPAEADRVSSPPACHEIGQRSAGFVGVADIAQREQVMKWSPLVTVLAATALASGCWRPYYNHQLAPPAYSQAPVYQQAPVVQAPPPVYAQPAPVMQQPCPPCQPVVCPPVCQPCY
jgi:hypothetical protein